MIYRLPACLSPRPSGIEERLGHSVMITNQQLLIYRIRLPLGAALVVRGPDQVRYGAKSENGFGNWRSAITISLSYACAI